MSGSNRRELFCWTLDRFCIPSIFLFWSVLFYYYHFNLLGCLNFLVDIFIVFFVIHCTLFILLQWWKNSVN
jgi:hypothetical protein